MDTWDETVRGILSYAAEFAVWLAVCESNNMFVYDNHSIPVYQ